MTALNMGVAMRERRGASVMPLALPIAALFTIGATIVGGGAVYLLTLFLTPMAPILAVIAGAFAQFAAAYAAVHRAGLEPVPFLRWYFFILWALLVIATIAMLIVTAWKGEAVAGNMMLAVILGPPVLAGLLTALPLLAVGDKEPPLR